MAGGGAGFFSGLLQSVGDGLQARSKQKFEKDQADKAEFSKALLTAIPNSDNPNILYQKFFELHGPDLHQAFGMETDPKGQPKGKGPMVEVLKNLPHLFSGAHQALSGAGGKDASGSAPEGASGDAGAPPANEPASGGGQASQFPFVPSRQEQDQRDAANAGRAVEAKADAELKVAQKGIDSGRFKNLNEAFSMLFGRRGAPSGIKVLSGASMSGEDVLKADPNAKGLSGEPLNVPAGTFLQRVDVPTDEGSEIRYVPAAKPRESANQAPGTFADTLKRRESEVGHPLSSKELLDLNSEWSKSHQAETPEQKQARARQMVDYRAKVAGAEAAKNTGRVSDNAQKVSMGGKDYKYLNLGSYKGAKDTASARNEALSNGITPLLPAQAEKVESAANSMDDAKLMLNQIRSSLPKDYKDRPWQALRNTTFKSIQADDALASYKAWGVAAMPIVRSLGAMGRITNVELQQAKDALPLITDTVGVAGEKVEILTGMMERGMRRVLDRGVNAGSEPSQGSTPPPASSAPKNPYR